MKLTPKQIKERLSGDHLDPYWLKDLEAYAIHLFQLHNMDMDEAYRSDREALTRAHWKGHGADIDEMLERWPWVGREGDDA